MNAITLDSVSKSFGSVRAVHDLNASVPVGTIFGFLGPNGAGKTTTLRMIMNIIYPDRGRIEILGNASAAQAKKHIGYMPEERGLYRKMRVDSVLSYLGGIKGMAPSDLKRAIPAWLDRVGLTRWAGKRVDELSRGMQQKLQFIVTVINDPKILILDEPFAGLDPVNLDLLKGIMLEMRQAGKTVIFSTHMMEQAERLCDLILLVNKGTKVTEGSLDEVRAERESDSVLVELQGDTSFVNALPGVARTQPDGNRLVIVLNDGADPQDLLKALVERVRVRTFEVKVPSLHEVFVRLVGQDNG